MLNIIYIYIYIYIYTRGIARYACLFFVRVENVTDGRTDAQKKGSKT